MLRPRRGRPAWAVPVLLFLAVLIVAALGFNLANLDTGGEGIPRGAGGAGAPSVFAVSLDPVLVTALMLGVGGPMFAGIVYLLIRNRGPRKRLARDRSWWELLTYCLGLLLILALLYAFPRILGRPGGEEMDSATGGGLGGNATAVPAAANAPVAVLLALAVFAAILAMTYLMRRGSSRFFGDATATRKVPDEREAATEAVQAAIAELELGADVRTAILGCFQRFCRLLGARGISDQAALTPRELERIAVERLRVSAPASSTLTALFEEARYSAHPLVESDRARAIDSLTGIRAALEA